VARNESQEVNDETEMKKSSNRNETKLLSIANIPVVQLILAIKPADVNVLQRYLPRSVCGNDSAA
jgi:hypothetical protein